MKSKYSLLYSVVWVWGDDLWAEGGGRAAEEQQVLWWGTGELMNRENEANPDTHTHPHAHTVVTTRLSDTHLQCTVIAPISFYLGNSDSVIKFITSTLQRQAYKQTL